MNEQIFNGDDIIHLICKYEQIEEYNSARCWINGIEYNIEDLKIIFYNDEND